MAITYFGSGICSHTRRRRDACLSVTGPVTIRISACRGEPLTRIPKRSISNRGIRHAMISISQALQAPLLKIVIQGDFIRAQFTRRWLRSAAGTAMVNHHLRGKI